MKRNNLLSILCLSAIMLLLITDASFASSRIDWSNVSPSTVAQAITQRDDTLVILEGTLTPLRRRDRFELRDTTGVVTIDMDCDFVPNKNAKAGQNVRIFGKVDRKVNRVKIDAKKVEIIQ